MTRVLLIGLASAIGGVARYALSGVVQRIGNGSFPVGTMVVNVTGCLLVGFFASACAGPYLIREDYRIALLIGFFGGFTTFSSFALETLLLAADGEYWSAAGNVALSALFGLGAAWLGYRLAQTWLGT